VKVIDTRQLTSSLVVFATTTMRSTSFPFIEDLWGGDRIIEAVCFKPFVAGDGDGDVGSRTGIRLNDPGDLLGFTEDFFLIDSGSTDAVDDLVGVLNTPSAGRIASKVGRVGVSSSERLRGKCGGLNAAMVSLSAWSISTSKADISASLGGGNVAHRGPPGFLGRAGKALAGVVFVGVIELRRWSSSSSSSISTSSSFLRCSPDTREIGGSSTVE
jgi:hypothetical protein